MKIALAGPYPQGTLERFQQLLPGHEVVPVLTQEEYDAPSDVQCIIVRVLKNAFAQAVRMKNELDYTI